MGVPETLSTMPESPDPKPLILIVEDDTALASEMSDTLSNYGFTTVVAHSWGAAQSELASRQPSLVLLDQRLGPVDTVTRVSEFRAATDAPIVFLTANGMETDRIVALELGADDFLVKPVSGRELVARARAHVRRGSARARRPVQRRSGWRLDVQHRALHRPDGSEVDLTSAEFNLLAALTDAEGRTVDRETLTRAVLQRGWNADDRSLDNLVARLRRKLGPGGDRSIATMRGLGYAFTDFPSA